MQWITCQNIYDETWRRLLEFANVELAYEEIEKRHGKATNSKLKANYTKQAEQINVALLQAKEYFEATNKSSLFTSPNHLYYGATSLSTACMLLLGDGAKSLDSLRKHSTNAHHGLGFSVGATAKSAKCGLNLLESCYVEILSNGHFKNWYETLPTNGTIPALVNRYFENNSNTNLEPIGEYQAPKFTDLIGEKHTILDLIKFFPDLHSELSRYGVEVICSRVSHIVNIKENHMEHIWNLHNPGSKDHLNKIIKGFKQHDNCKKYFCYNFNQDKPNGSITINIKDNEGGFSFPSSRETLYHNQIYYADEVERHEIADCLLVSYSLSMLSRYFPDIWVSCLQSHCKASKLIERCIEILSIKFPIMTLSFLTGRNIKISTNRPFWH